MSNSLDKIISVLQNLADGDADEFAALDQILDACVSAFEESKLIDYCYDIIEASQQLVDKSGVDRRMVDIAYELSQLSREIQYGVFPEDQVENARENVEMLMSCLEKLLEYE